MAGKNRKNKPKQTAREKRDSIGHILARKRKSLRECPEIPKKKMSARRKRTRQDLSGFLQEYMPAAFYLPMSADHLKVIEKIQRSIMRGGAFAEAMPRGNGKTTIVRGAALWAILNGHRKFIAIIGAEAEHAKKIMEGIMMECSQNELIHEDFPEVTIPARHIDGIGQRAAGQLYKGKRTHIKWNRDLVVFPMIPRSRAAGAVIMPRGLTGAIRGMQYASADGKVLRPDFVLLDDPQTEESAKSPKQTEDRAELIDKAIMGLGGPERRISAVMPCTIIRRGDLSDQFLNHNLHPEWQGECTKMVYKWPAAQDTLWAEYSEIRKAGLVEGDHGAEATAFYRKNRKQMDKGSQVAWEYRHNEDEISALQHAENLRIDRGDGAFMSEYQNSPEQAHPALYEITPEIVSQKLNAHPPFLAPDPSIHIGAFVDVNPAYGLHFLAMWFFPDLTGGVIAYGKYPQHENKRLYTADMPESEEQVIFKGLDSVALILNEMSFTRAGSPAAIDLLLVDCGYKMKTIFQWVKARAHTFPKIRNLAPSRGWGGKNYKQRQAIVRGDNWHLTEFSGKGRVIVHNSDAWRVYSQKAFLLPAGAPGSFTIYGTDPRMHIKLAQHIASEKLIEYIRGDTAEFWNWTMQPGEHNDLLDCVVGCTVGASFRGCDQHIKQVQESKAAGSSRAPKRKRPRMKHHNI